MRVAAGNPIVPVLTEAGVPWEVCVHDPNTMIFSFYTYQEGKPATDVSLWQQAMNLVTFQREWADNAVSNTLYFKPKWELCAVINPTVLDLRGYLHSKRLAEEIIESGVDYDGLTVRVKYVDDKLHIYRYNMNHEEDIIEQVISHIVPLTKSLSLLPHSGAGAYAQMPESALSESEYENRPTYNFNWSLFLNSEGQDERFCDAGGTCEISPGG